MVWNNWGMWLTLPADSSCRSWDLIISDHRAIIEHVAQLCSGILPFGARGVYTAKWLFRPATWLCGYWTLFYVQIRIVINVFDPLNVQEILANIVKLILSARQLFLRERLYCHTLRTNFAQVKPRIFAHPKLRHFRTPTSGTLTP